MLQLAFDIGGTFTDFVLYDPQSTSLKMWKVPTTPREPARAVIEALAQRIEVGEFSSDEIGAVLHATTVATNAILERRGSRTAVIATRGFRDVLLIGRQKRYDTNNLHLKKPRPLVERADIFEVSERVAADGSVVQPLDEGEVHRVAAKIRSGAYESVAVIFLHAYANPAHEERVAAILGQILSGVDVTLSSVVSPKVREYERTSTTVANAYVRPLVDGYLRALTSSLADLGVDRSLSIMQSNGGLVSPELARTHPIRIVESGPAAGVLMCAEVGTQEGYDRVLTFDMGGTTAKLGAVDGGDPVVASSFEVDAINYTKGSGLPLNITAIELLEIGAGGGSLARAEMGLIAVGPQSAGAQPGPICYGRGGTQPTITDANLVLGYLNPSYFNGGAMGLDLPGAMAGIERDIAKPLGLSLVEAAWGVHSVANANMERAMRIISVERGRDPRRHALVAFGGAGPLHACRLARNMGIPRVIVPRGAGVGSALGLLYADHKIDVGMTRLMLLDRSGDESVAAVLLTLRRRLDQELSGQRLKGHPTIRFSASMRYVGQGYEIRVELPDLSQSMGAKTAIRDAFQAAYLREYGYTDTESEIEIVDWYATATFEGSRATRWVSSQSSTRSGDPIVSRRDAYFPESGGLVSAAVVDRYLLSADVTIEGPALIEERESTTVILPGDKASVSAKGNLIVEIGGHTS